jgi:hypothetical protein
MAMLFVFRSGTPGEVVDVEQSVQQILVEQMDVHQGEIDRTSFQRWSSVGKVMLWVRIILIVWKRSLSRTSGL